MEASEQVRLLEDRDGDGLYETSSIFSDNYKDAVDGTAAGVLWSNALAYHAVPLAPRSQLVALQHGRLTQQGDGNPSGSMAQLNGVALSTAQGWITKARDRGLLPPGRRGRAG